MAESLCRVDVQRCSRIIRLANTMYLILLRGHSPLPQTVSSLATAKYLQGATVPEQNKQYCQGKHLLPASIMLQTDNLSPTI
jgi:hypothetical protein